MATQRDEPIRSKFAHDPDLEERLEGFLLGLGERIDMVQEADRAGELKNAGRRARALAAEASELGFPLLVGSAQNVAECCDRGEALQAHERIVDLTEVVRRVRLGHRGAF